MAEKLTKTALKNELTRRIAWFEKSYGFNIEYNSTHDMAENPSLLIAYGRYCALVDIRYQIERNLFIDGFAC